MHKHQQIMGLLLSWLMSIQRLFTDETRANCKALSLCTHIVIYRTVVYSQHVATRFTQGTNDGRE